MIHRMHTHDVSMHAMYHRNGALLFSREERSKCLHACAAPCRPEPCSIYRVKFTSQVPFSRWSFWSLSHCFALILSSQLLVPIFVACHGTFTMSCKQRCADDMIVRVRMLYTHERINSHDMTVSYESGPSDCKRVQK